MNDEDYVVYFVSDGHNSVKIGISKMVSFTDRLSALQVGNPKKLKPILFIERDGKRKALILEKLLHGRFINTKLKGEWFFKCRTLSDFIDEVSKDYEDALWYNTVMNSDTSNDLLEYLYND